MYFKRKKEKEEDEEEETKICLRLYNRNDMLLSY